MSNYPWFPKAAQIRYEEILSYGEIREKEQKRKEFTNCWGEMVNMFLSLYDDYGKNWMRSENFSNYLKNKK